MNYPINLSHYINYNFSLMVIIILLLIILLLALYEDLKEIPQSKELSIVINKTLADTIINSITEIQKLKKDQIQGQGNFITGKELELYFEQSKKRESENKPKYEKPKYEIEKNKSTWVWREFQLAAKTIANNSKPKFNKTLLLEYKPRLNLIKNKFKEVEK